MNKFINGLAFDDAQSWQKYFAAMQKAVDDLYADGKPMPPSEPMKDDEK